MLILMVLVLLYGGVLTCHTELRRMYSLTRSRRSQIGSSSNGPLFVLSDGSASFNNSNYLFGVARLHSATP